ncbi:MAG: ABC transporter ATP-binding protein, partial [Solirubrobacteraceae bacterium]
EHLVMIDAGSLVVQGCVGGSLQPQRSGLIETPEHPPDAPALAEICAAAGHPARVDGESVRIQAPEEWAAELNREAMATGITLRGLRVVRASLEEAFFAITEGQAGE